jgi:hypothetical protein
MSSTSETVARHKAETARLHAQKLEADRRWRAEQDRKQEAERRAANARRK